MFGMGRAFTAWFVFCVVLGLSVLGVGLWAVITVVNHYT